MKVLYKIIVFICLLLPFSADGQKPTDTIIGQTITYHSTKATEVYLVWGINSWAGIPAKEFQPANTFIKKDMAWSKMVGTKDSFSIFLQSPKGTTMNFMFWVTKDSTGRSTDGWDTYGEQTYSSDFTENKKIDLNDSALWLPSKEFNILGSGWLFLCIAGILFIVSLLVNRNRLGLSGNNFLKGLLFFTVVMIVVTRFQMNSWFEENRFAILGGIFSDLIWLMVLSGFFMLLLYVARKRKLIQQAITVLFALMVVLTVLYSLINIVIVKQIGNPLNYQWLYYSDFMNGVDAKSAVSHNLTSALVLNLLLLAGSVLISGIAFSFFKKPFPRNVNIACVALLLIVLGVGFYQTRIIKFQEGRIANPAIALITSTINADKESQLFSMQVSDSTRRYMEKMHSIDYGLNLNAGDSINNIVVLVLESTPHQYISLYDSSFTVTPNLKKWKNASLVFNNAYAHIPATPNSMGNIVSGVYPLLSYQSFITKYPHTSIPSIPKELGGKGWSSSLFFSSDLKFSNMAEYATTAGFGHVEDYGTLSCDGYKKFDFTHTSLDGVDDRCLIERYFKNYDKDKSRKKFSLLWTDQTHYPYMASGEEIIYTKQNKELNRYLNALKTADDAFGSLMDGLVQRNILQNTLVIVVADHGEAFGTHDQYSHATRIYEENIHIPYIFFHPNYFHGTTSNEIVGLIDLAPTITQIAGIKKPAEWQGKSVLSSVAGERTFFISPYSDFLFGTRGKRWKYIFNATTNEGELYDLSNDPAELNSVVDQYPDIAKKEHEILAAWVQYHSGKLKLWATKH